MCNILQNDNMIQWFREVYMQAEIKFWIVEFKMFLNLLKILCINVWKICMNHSFICLYFLQYFHSNLKLILMCGGVIYPQKGSCTEIFKKVMRPWLLFIKHSTECHGPVISTRALWGPRLKSKPRDHLSWLRLCVVSCFHILIHYFLIILPSDAV